MPSGVAIRSALAPPPQHRAARRAHQGPPPRPKAVVDTSTQRSADHVPPQMGPPAAKAADAPVKARATPPRRVAEGAPADRRRGRRRAPAAHPRARAPARRGRLALVVSGVVTVAGAARASRRRHGRAPRHRPDSGPGAAVDADRAHRRHRPARSAIAGARTPSRPTGPASPSCASAARAARSSAPPSSTHRWPRPTSSRGRRHRVRARRGGRTHFRKRWSCAPTSTSATSSSSTPSSRCCCGSRPICRGRPPPRARRSRVTPATRSSGTSAALRPGGRGAGGERAYVERALALDPRTPRP